MLYGRGIESCVQALDGSLLWAANEETALPDGVLGESPRAPLSSKGDLLFRGRLTCRRNLGGFSASYDYVQ